MPSIEIRINSKHHATVSLGDAPGVISCIVNYMNRSKEEGFEDEYFTSFGGIDTSSGEHVKWDDIQLKAGDEITYKLIEESIAHPMPKRSRHDDDRAEYSKKDYIRQCAKDFGWTIIENKKQP